ncbi:sensor histidine kinase [Coraliomargarita sp. W4R53]
MNLPFQSIRWRIQAWHGLILLIAIVAFCATAYQLAWFNQSRRIDREIQRNERQLFKSLTEANQATLSESNKSTKRIPFPEELFQIIQQGSIQIPEDALNNFSGSVDGYYYFAFADADGEVLIQSDNAPTELNFLPAPSEEGMQEEFRTRGNIRESAHSFNFGFRILIGHDITTELEEKHRFGWSLGASGCGLWLVGLLGGWWLAGKAIRPIQSISQTATRIAEGNLNERINTAGTDSELDQLSHVLNHSFDRLNATLEQQRQFTADASHELRTPLTILLSESQRMCKREIARSSEDYQESFELCHDAATRMRRLVESLLLLARQDGDSAVQAVVDCDLANIIKDSVSLNQSLAEDKKVHLECKLPACPYQGSPDLLAIVFNNLVGNAVQHHQGNGLVQISLTTEEDAIAITIADDGPGISAEALPRIFDRFYRADPARSDAHAGHSGLGLALAQTIIQNMGGQIEVTSELKQGSTFTVILPKTS